MEYAARGLERLFFEIVREGKVVGQLDRPSFDRVSLALIGASNRGAYPGAELESSVLRHPRDLQYNERSDS